jgi:hypothetical protein
MITAGVRPVRGCLRRNSRGATRASLPAVEIIIRDLIIPQNGTLEGVNHDLVARESCRRTVCSCALWV